MNFSSEDPAVVPQHRPLHYSVWSFLWEVIKFVILALLIVVPLRVYVAQPYIVSGSSMDPTFGDKNYIIVDQLSYRFNDPQRGDVIIFRFPQEPSKFFIKRVIGLPEETISVRDGKLFITDLNGMEFIFEEPYLPQNYHDTFSTTLKEDDYFVMGDNRNASLDSRVWGPLKDTFIVGRALIRLLPITEIAFFPGKYELVEVPFVPLTPK